MAPKAPLEKFSGQSAKSGYLKIVKRGDPLGRQGVESLRGGGRLPPLNPLLRVGEKMVSCKIDDSLICVRNEMSKIGDELCE